MKNSVTEYRKTPQEQFSDCVIYALSGSRQAPPMLRTGELLKLLEERGVSKTLIARTLGLSNSRVTELYKGDRAMKLDEAATLCEKFDLEQPLAPKTPPLPPAVSRLIVLYVAEALGSGVDESQVSGIAQDIQAFSEYVRDPAVRERVEMAQQFLEIMRLRRQQVPAA